MWKTRTRLAAWVTALAFALTLAFQTLATPAHATIPDCDCPEDKICIRAWIWINGTQHPAGHCENAPDQWTELTNPDGGHQHGGWGAGFEARIFSPL